MTKFVDAFEVVTDVQTTDPAPASSTVLTVEAPVGTRAVSAGCKPLMGGGILGDWPEEDLSGWNFRVSGEELDFELSLVVAS